MPPDEDVAALLGAGYGRVLWEPGPEVIEQAQITQYQRWLAGQRGVATGSYAELWDWSVAEPAAFWDSIWDYFDVLGQRGVGPALTGPLPDTEWFPGATLNYARNALRTASTDPDRVAIIAAAEDGAAAQHDLRELAAEVARVQAALRGLGVTRATGSPATCRTCPKR